MGAVKASRRRARRAAFGNIRELTSGRYQASYVADGKRRSLGTFATKTEAANRLAMVQRDRYVGEWRDPAVGDVAVSEYIEDWIASSTTKADSTRDLYARMLRTWIAARLTVTSRSGATRVVQLGSRSIAGVTSRDVREWHSAVIEESVRRAEVRHRRQQSSPSTANAAIRGWARLTGHEMAATGRIPGEIRAAWESAGGPARLAAVEADRNAGRTEPAQAYRVLHAAMAQAVRDKIIRESPCDLAGAMQGDSKLRAERQALNIREVRLLAEQMPHRYAIAVWIAATCGLRSGELFGLQRKHVDLASGRLVIEQALDRSGRRTFAATKTSAGRRVVDMPASVVKMLGEHMERYTPPGVDSLVFGTSTGRPLSNSSRSKLMIRARRAIGHEGLTWHDLRHSAVTMTYELNVPEAAALARHGHAGRRSALRYQHQRTGAGAVIAAQIDERIAIEVSRLSAFS